MSSVSVTARLVILTFVLLTVSRASAQYEVPPVTYPDLSATAMTAEGFVPDGWAIERNLEGDLNADGVSDLVLLLHQDDPHNIFENPDRGGDEMMNTNPRILAIAFGTGSSPAYTLAVENHTLIPRHAEPMFVEPFVDLTLGRGTFVVSLQNWKNWGTQGGSDIKFVFRYQKGCFSLIGYDRNSATPIDGTTRNLSINYSTGKANVVTGNLDNDRTRSTSKKVARRALCLDDVGSGLEYDPGF